VGQPVKSNNNNVSKDISKMAPPPHYINPLLQSPSRLSDEPARTKQSELLEEFQQRISKLAEIKTLLAPYLSHQDICTILTPLVIECISSGSDDFLDQNLIKVRQIVKFRQDVDQLSSPDLPLSMHNNMAVTDTASSLIGNNRFITQNNFQKSPPSFTSPPPLLQQQQQQQEQNFHPIFFLTLLRPPRSLDEISNNTHNISPKS
jgi:hypothetical protein